MIHIYLIQFLTKYVKMHMRQVHMRQVHLRQVYLRQVLRILLLDFLPPLLPLRWRIDLCNFFIALSIDSCSGFISLFSILLRCCIICWLCNTQLFYFIDTQQQWWTPLRFAGFRPWSLEQTRRRIETGWVSRPFWAAQCSHPRGTAAVACSEWWNRCS